MASPARARKREAEATAEGNTKRIRIEDLLQQPIIYQPEPRRPLGSCSLINVPDSDSVPQWLESVAATDSRRDGDADHRQGENQQDSHPDHPDRDEADVSYWLNWLAADLENPGSQAPALLPTPDSCDAAACASQPGPAGSADGHHQHNHCNTSRSLDPRQHRGRRLQKRVYIRDICLAERPPAPYVEVSGGAWRARRSSPAPPAERSGVAINILASRGDACTDQDVGDFLRAVVLPAVTDPTCGRSAGLGVAPLSVVSLVQPLGQAGGNSMSSAARFGSDFLYGYHRGVFTSPQLAALETAHRRTRSEGAARQPVPFPFLAVHFGGPGGPRGARPGFDVCIVAASACLEPVGSIQDALPRRRDPTIGVDGWAFSLIINDKHAHLYEAWRSSPGVYHVVWLRAFFLCDIDHVMALRAAVRNVMDWGASTRLRQIKATADHLRQEQIGGAMRHLGLGQVESATDRIRLGQMGDAVDRLRVAAAERAIASCGRPQPPNLVLTGHLNDGLPVTKVGQL